jgi:hypothetical protein
MAALMRSVVHQHDSLQAGDHPSTIINILIIIIIVVVVIVIIQSTSSSVSSSSSSSPTSPASTWTALEDAASWAAQCRPASNSAHHIYIRFDTNSDIDINIDDDDIARIATGIAVDSSVRPRGVLSETAHRAEAPALARRPLDAVLERIGRRSAPIAVRVVRRRGGEGLHVES